MIPVPSITASELQTRCLEILDDLPPDGLLITKRGKTVARLVPTGVDNSDLIGSIPDAEITGDIFSTGAEWPLRAP